MASLTPEFVQKAQKAWGDQFEDKLRSVLPWNMDAVTDCRITKEEILSDSEVQLIYVLSERQTIGDSVQNRATGYNIGVKRVGGQWKLDP